MLLSRIRFNSGFLSHICHDCTHHGISYCKHIEGT